MKICVVPLGLLGAVAIFGQGTSNSNWQNRCFNNPGLPYCQGRDFAVKPKPAAKDTSSGVTRGTGATAAPSASGARRQQGGSAPALMTVGDIDWRFADPFPDALIGFNFNGIVESPLARSLINQLGARQKLSEADMQKIFDGLSGIDQIGVSVRDNRFVVMLTGSVTAMMKPPAEPGIKCVPISGSAMLFGSADAVDQAVQRINMGVPLSELARSGEQRQSTSEFWAVGSARLAGPEAVRVGLRRFALTVWIRNQIISDLALEFNTPPAAKMVQAMQGSVEGNTVHKRTSIEASEVQSKFAEIVAGPVGERLAELVEAGKYLPARDATAPRQTKPVIYGLDGGPKVVGQDKER